MTRYRQHPEVVATVLLDSEVVLLRLDTQEYFSLNETGGVIWNTFHEPASVQDAAEALMADYEVDDETALASAQRVSDRLRRDGLLLDAG